MTYYILLSTAWTLGILFFVLLFLGMYYYIDGVTRRSKLFGVGMLVASLFVLLVDIWIVVALNIGMVCRTYTCYIGG